MQSPKLFWHLPLKHYPDKPNQNVFPHTEPEKVENFIDDGDTKINDYDRKSGGQVGSLHNNE